MSPAERSERVRALVAEVFRETGKPLSNDDPMVVVAVLFRATLDQWMAEHPAALEQRALHAESHIARVIDKLNTAVGSVFDQHAAKTRAVFASELEEAFAKAQLAVENTPPRHRGDTPWKYRMEGFGIAIATILLGAFLLHWFGPHT